MDCRASNLRPPISSKCRPIARSAGDAMVARNAKRRRRNSWRKTRKEKGVVTTASGLEYKILAAGDKKAPAISAHRQSDRGLSRQADRWHGIRQFVFARRAGDFPGQRRHQGLAGSAGADEAGREMAAVHTAGTGLRRTRPAENSGRFVADFRGERDQRAKPPARRRKAPPGTPPPVQ